MQSEFEELVAGTLFDVQVTPESGEVQMAPPFATAASRFPSAEEATQSQCHNGALDFVISCPELVEV